MVKFLSAWICQTKIPAKDDVDHHSEHPEKVPLTLITAHNEETLRKNGYIRSILKLKPFKNKYHLLDPGSGGSLRFRQMRDFIWVISAKSGLRRSETHVWPSCCWIGDSSSRKLLNTETQILCKKKWEFCARGWICFILVVLNRVLQKSGTTKNQARVYLILTCPHSAGGKILHETLHLTSCTWLQF